MHPSLERLYEAAKSLTPPITGKSAVASWLNESPQAVNNWEKRGVSRRGALAAQELSGYSAAWILNGTGEKLIGGEAKDVGSHVHELTDEEWAMLNNYRILLDKDREGLDRQIAQLARERQAEFDEFQARLGVRSAIARANARKGRAPSTTADPADPALRQRPLPGVE